MYLCERIIQVMDLHKRNTSIYYATQLLHSLIFTIPIWIVYYQGKISVVEISSLISIQYVFQIILELPSGALADLIGRKYTNFFGFVIGAVSFLIFPLATNYWHFLILACMAGILDSFRSGSEEALLYDSYKQSNNESLFKKAYANGNMLYQVGLITATALGGFLFNINYAIPYVLYGVCLMIGAALILFYIEPKIDSQRFSFKNYLKQISDGAKQVFKNEYTKNLSLFYIFVGGIAWSSTIYFNEFMMVDFGFGNDTRGYLSAGMRVLNVLLIGSVLKNDKLFNFSRTVIFFPLVMLVAYTPGIFLNGVFGLPFIQMAMIATTARWIVLSPLTNETFDSKYRATAISFLSLLIGFVYVFLTGISGPLISTLGIKTMYSLLGLVTLLTVVPIGYRLLRIGNYSPYY